MGNIFDMHLAVEPFEKIVREKKTVEIRLYDEKRKKIAVGDLIVFHCLPNDTDIFITEVLALHRFKTFRELFSSELFDKTGCGDMTVDSATEYMHRFYKNEQEERDGVLGIEIRHIKNLMHVYWMLKDVYIDCNIHNEDIVRFAIYLNNYIFIENGDLTEILSIVYDFEEAMRNRGAVIDIGRQCSIYDRIINCLAMNEENAKRLYESFLCYHDCQAFSLLMNEYEEWLSQEQRDEILSIAREVFIECVWEDYV